MAERGTNYTNPIETLGLQIVVAAPVDDRVIVDTETVLVELFIAPETAEKINYRAVLYDSMLVLAKDTKRIYTWIESDVGIMAAGYTYPSYMTNEQGQDYGDKTYNFVLHTPSNKITKTYTSGVDAFILIENSLLPYVVLAGNGVGAQVFMKSSEDGYQAMQFPDHLEMVAGGLQVYFDPIPAMNEVFNITII